MREIVSIMGLTLLGFITAGAQGFSSGSTGADGALDLSNCSGSGCTVQVPDSGILNYTTVNIPSGTMLVFKRNRLNTPITLRAQGDVTIAGQISVDAPGNMFSPFSSPTADNPGPGGFRGGTNNGNGFGPGGGMCCSAASLNGNWVGALSLIPLIGGSGGASNNGTSGGGGGGAIVIASSTSIQMAASGGISANGITWASTGSGGALRLVANILSIAGTLSAQGLRIGDNGFSIASVPGTDGVIRLEAPGNGLNYTGNSHPAAVLADINSVIVQTTAPLLSIVSIGGFPVPSHSGLRVDSVDVLLPLQLSDPINVAVQGVNIPVGTTISIQQSGNAGAMSPTCTLAGSPTSSSASCTISNVNRSALTYLLAVATFPTPASAQLVNPRGKYHVAKIQIESITGAKSKYVFLRADGRRIAQSKLPKKFLEQFGL